MRGACPGAVALTYSRDCYTSQTMHIFIAEVLLSVGDELCLGVSACGKAILKTVNLLQSQVRSDKVSALLYICALLWGGGCLGS